MTLQQLKQILDNGGTLTSEEKKLYKKDGKYYFDNGHGEGDVCSNHFTEYALTAVEWSDVKPEPPIHNILQKPITNTLSRAYIPPEAKEFAPRMMVIDCREWEAMQKELEELRTFKASHWSTFDAPTEYGK
jgi:hypothetical protein